MSRSHTPASAAASGALAGTTSSTYTGTRPISGGNLDLDHVIGGPRPASALSHNELVSSAGDRDRDRDSAYNTLSTPHRSGTLKKKASLKRTSSLGRVPPSRRSSTAGSVRSIRQSERSRYDDDSIDHNSAFYTPIPTSGSPTDLLADRFQAWRKVLKDLINYFRDLHKATEARCKNLQPSTNLINTTTIPPQFLTHGGLGDALDALQDYHKQAIAEANKARDLENEVIVQLTGLRSDLQQKIKEIKSLSGDFKNSVDKEQENTRKVHRALHDSLGLVDQDAAATSGKGDPFLIKLSVDRQIERQIEEENYLHRAYLNLEASGRELESIVVGEIQKAYNVLAGILNRDATNAFESAARLREGPLAIKKDYEWDYFTKTSKQMVDPDIPLRSAAHIVYPGQDHPAAIEVRSGMLERKSKYLKNYTPGWYILSPTHLHEFKSADRILYQSPVMSLYLPEQKLGSHSEPSSSSHKFMLKGRQSGSMHRGHSWVFRAETHDTMLAWYNDIKELTEKRGEARNEFVRRSHARSLSGTSLRAASINSSEGDMAEDEADRAPFAGEQSVRGPSSAPGGVGAAAAAGAAAAGLAARHTADLDDQQRPEAGWRPLADRAQESRGSFPSDVNLTRTLPLSISPSSGTGSDRDAGAAAAAADNLSQPSQSPTSARAYADGHRGVDAPASPTLYSAQTASASLPAAASHTESARPQIAPPPQHHTGSSYGEWMAPLGVATAAGGAALVADDIHHRHNAAANQQVRQAQQQLQEQQQQQQQQQITGGHTGAVSAAAVVSVPGAGQEEGERSLSRPRGLTESTQGTTYFAPSTIGGATINTSTTSPTEYSDSPNEVERIRPEKTETSRSITTLSDLPIPGQFPKSSAAAVIDEAAAAAEPVAA